MKKDDNKQTNKQTKTTKQNKQTNKNNKTKQTNKQNKNLTCIWNNTVLSVFFFRASWLQTNKPATTNKQRKKQTTRRTHVYPVLGEQFA